MLWQDENGKEKPLEKSSLFDILVDIAVLLCIVVAIVAIVSWGWSKQLQ